MILGILGVLRQRDFFGETSRTDEQPGENERTKPAPATKAVVGKYKQIDNPPLRLFGKEVRVTTDREKSGGQKPWANLATDQAALRRYGAEILPRLRERFGA